MKGHKTDFVNDVKYECVPPPPHQNLSEILFLITFLIFILNLVLISIQIAKYDCFNILNSTY